MKKYDEIVLQKQLIKRIVRGLLITIPILLVVGLIVVNIVSQLMMCIIFVCIMTIIFFVERAIYQRHKLIKKSTAPKKDVFK